jgi:hypothetical protein
MPRVPYGEDTRIHIYLQNLESSIGQYDNYDKSSWHIYDKNDKAICHFLIKLPLGSAGNQAPKW